MGDVSPAPDYQEPMKRGPAVTVEQQSGDDDKGDVALELATNTPPPKRFSGVRHATTPAHASTALPTL